ncbi:DUF86 domain-containing protein [bacterium]|nr:DUF86 domain-containing protein [bacterium]
MLDRELCQEVLRQVETAAARIVTRFEAIRQVSDFTDSPAGIEKMDAICMMLIVVGESLKHLDKITGGELLSRYPDVDWKNAKGMRDIITHHYANVDATTVFFTCKRKMPRLLETIRRMIREFE